MPTTELGRFENAEILIIPYCVVCWMLGFESFVYAYVDVSSCSRTLSGLQVHRERGQKVIYHVVGCKIPLSSSIFAPQQINGIIIAHDHLRLARSHRQSLCIDFPVIQTDSSTGWRLACLQCNWCTINHLLCSIVRLKLDLSGWLLLAGYHTMHALFSHALCLDETLRRRVQSTLRDAHLTWASQPTYLMVCRCRGKLFA